MPEGNLARMAVPISSTRPRTRTRCLWIGRDLPFPEDTGDKIYSGRLASALAQAGAEVTFLGFGNAASQPDLAESLTWVGVPGPRRPYWQAMFSLQPLVCAALATPRMQAALEQLLASPWNAIVLDNYGAAWALPRIQRFIAAQSSRPLLVHVSHNFETGLARHLYQGYTGSPAKRAFLYLNYLKIRSLESRLARHADVLTSITPEDCSVYATHSRQPPITLTPGYSGPRRAPRTIDQTVARRVLLVGSFRWVVKQANLRQLVSAADAKFAACGIALDVVGDVPVELRRELGPLAATQFHGFVDDPTPYFVNARIAIVPEAIGGGFKLKFLDYIFGRVAVATMAAATAGLPEAVRIHLLTADSLTALVDVIIDNIDDVAKLQQLQQAAFDAAAANFEWHDRGTELLAAIERALPAHT